MIPEPTAGYRYTDEDSFRLAEHLAAMDYDELCIVLWAALDAKRAGADER